MGMRIFVKVMVAIFSKTNRVLIHDWLVTRTLTPIQSSFMMKSCRCEQTISSQTMIDIKIDFLIAHKGINIMEGVQTSRNNEEESQSIRATPVRDWYLFVDPERMKLERKDRWNNVKNFARRGNVSLSILLLPTKAIHREDK